MLSPTPLVQKDTYNISHGHWMSSGKGSYRGWSAFDALAKSVVWGEMSEGYSEDIRWNIETFLGIREEEDLVLRGRTS